VKILTKRLDELKENEFKDLYPVENDIETKEYVKKTFRSIMILSHVVSDEYINNVMSD
jgi:transcription-repair coupling factor (superfamily II helicase)